MKFNKALDEAAIDDAVENFKKTYAKSIDKPQPLKSPAGAGDVIKIEFGGVDRVTTGTAFGDVSTLQISDIFINGRRAQAGIGKKIRFASGSEAQADAYAAAQVILPYDKTFAQKLGDACRSIAQRPSKFAPKNNIFDIVYDSKTQTITSTPDV